MKTLTLICVLLLVPCFTSAQSNKEQLMTVYAKLDAVVKEWTTKERTLSQSHPGCNADVQCRANRDQLRKVYAPKAEALYDEADAIVGVKFENDEAKLNHMPSNAGQVANRILDYIRTH